MQHINFANESKQAFLVTAKCGHVGKDRYLPITFPVAAASAKQAAARVRQYARVKHHHKDAILRVEAVTWKEFQCQQDKNDLDPYLLVNRRKYQAIHLQEILSRTLPEPNGQPKSKREISQRARFQGKTKVRYPKAFLRYTNQEDGKLWGYCHSSLPSEQ